MNRTSAKASGRTNAQLAYMNRMKRVFAAVDQA